MATTLNQLKTRLALIQGAISGVTRAYAQAPRTLGADLPAFVNLTGPAAHNWQILGADGDYEQRDILMRLHVIPWELGIPGESEELVEPFLERVRTAFSARPGLGSYGLGLAGASEFGPLEGVLRAYLVGDNGINGYIYAGQSYVGVEFRLRVMSIIAVSYAARE